MKDLSNRTLGIIHATLLTTQAIAPYLNKIIPDVKVVHFVDDTIQRDNLAAGVGVVPKVNYYKFTQYAHNLQEAGADIILLACSTFNYAAELARPMIDIPIAQIDRPMMEAAVRDGNKIGLLATLPMTVPASTRLLQIAAEEAGKTVEIETVLCARAFEELQKGNTEKHNEMLIEEISSLSGRVDAIVMAQLSMSALAPYLPSVGVPIYNSGDTGVGRIRELFEKME